MTADMLCFPLTQLFLQEVSCCIGRMFERMKDCQKFKSSLNINISSVSEKKEKQINKVNE